MSFLDDPPRSDLDHDQRSGAQRERGLESVAAPRRARVAVPYDISSSSPMGVASAVGDRCEIVWVIDRRDPSLGPMARLLPRLGPVVDIGGRDLDDVASDLAELGVGGVVTFTDTQLLIASGLATALGLPANPPEVVERLNDKYVQRERLRTAGLPMPSIRLVPVGSYPDRALRALRDLHFPLVVKPRRGDSSRDVTLVSGVTSLREVIVALCPLTDVVVEEYLDDRAPGGHQPFGQYVSVEMIVQDGVPASLAVTGKFPLARQFRETGNFLPHPLSRADAADVVELAEAAAAALEVHAGALHTEIKLTPDGPRIIEVNGRVGGGAIDSLYARTHGISLTELAVAVALGDRVDLVPEAPAHHQGPFAYDFFVQPPIWAKRLESVAGVDSILERRGVETVAANRSPGDELDWRAGSQGYILQVSGTAADLSELAAVPASILAVAEVGYSGTATPLTSA